MANTTGTTAKKTGASRTPRKSKVQQTAETAVNNASDVETPVGQAEQPVIQAKPAEAQKYQVKVNLDPDMYVSVRNGFNGKLIYKSMKTGERWVWERFGDEQDMELRELRAARTYYKAFFENNWFMIDDPEVISYLGVERYYTNTLSYDEFDALFKMKPDEIEERIAHLPKGQKMSLCYRARELIREGSIDSLKVIDALEKALGIELIER